MTKEEGNAVVLTEQVHADLRLAWKLLDDAGHRAAADRVFQLLSERKASQNSVVARWDAVLPFDPVNNVPYLNAIGVNQNEASVNLGLIDLDEVVLGRIVFDAVIVERVARKDK